MGAQELRRVVCSERRGPHRTPGEHPRRAAATCRFDGHWVALRVDALREHDPRTRHRRVDPAAPRSDLVGFARTVRRNLALVEVAPDPAELMRRLDDGGL